VIPNKKVKLCANEANPYAFLNCNFDKKCYKSKIDSIYRDHKGSTEEQSRSQCSRGRRRNR